MVPTTLLSSSKTKRLLPPPSHDVDPIEPAVSLPALCRKTGIPYVVVKGKAHLGTVAHKKTAAVLAPSERQERAYLQLGTPPKQHLL